MFFNIALFSILWIVPTVLGHVNHRSRFVNRDSGSSIVQNSPSWSGVALDKENGTFTTVSTTFKVPVISGSPNCGVSTWIGIDGHTYECQALFQCGVDAVIDYEGSPTYQAWCEWYPANSLSFTDFPVSAGDVIRVSIKASSSTSGIGEIENLTTGKAANMTLKSTEPLCHRSAEWIVEDFEDVGYSDDYDGLLAKFDNITFTDAIATGPSGNYTTKGAIIINLQKDQLLTSVSNDESTVIIKYL